MSRPHRPSSICRMRGLLVVLAGACVLPVVAQPLSPPAMPASALMSQATVLPAAVVEQVEQWLVRGEDQPERWLRHLQGDIKPAAELDPALWQRLVARARGQIAARSGRADVVEASLARLADLARQANPAAQAQLEADQALLRALQADLAGEAELAARQASLADAGYARACAGTTGGAGDCDLRAAWQALRLLVIRAQSQGNLVESVSLLERGIAQSTRLDDALLQAWGLAWLANLQQALGDEVQARRQIDLADRVARRHPDAQALVRVRFYESSLALARNEPVRARQAMEEAQRLSRSLGSERLTAQIEANLSDLLRRAGLAREALAAVEHALPVMRRHSDLRNQPLLLHNGGLARLQLGQVVQGRADLEAALSLWEQTGSKGAMAAALRETSDALAAIGDVRGALDFHHREQQLRGDIDRANREAVLSQLRARYRSESEARELSLLARQNSLSAARLQTQSLNERIWLLAGLLLLLGLGVAGLLLKRARDANLLLRKSEALLRVQSERDPLTGLANRRHFREVLAAQAADGGFRGAMLLLDIDHFKRVNDEFGHPAGDAVLVEVALRLGHSVRVGDLASRWGGEEFLVFAPALRGEGLEALADRILCAVGDTPVLLPDGRLLRVTTSIGYACFPLPDHHLPMNWEQAVNLVDMALYTAKSMGRDRAVGLNALRADDATALHDIERDFELARLAGDIELKHLTRPGA